MNLNEIRAALASGDPRAASVPRGPLLLGCGMVDAPLPRWADEDTMGLRALTADDLSHVHVNRPIVGRVWHLVSGARPGHVLVGRGQDNDIVIVDFPISRHHCEFFRADGGVGLTDAGSHNGTWVNGHRLVPGQSVLVRSGDVVTLGRFALRYYRTLRDAVLDPNPLEGFKALSRAA